LQWIVDDGVPDRGHREALLDGNYTHVGIFTGPHLDKKLKMMTTQVLAYW